VDSDPKGAEPFCRIRIRIIGSDKESKGSECKFYVVKLEFSCFKSSILPVSTETLTLKLVKYRTSFPNIKLLNSKNFDFEKTLHI